MRQHNWASPALMLPMPITLHPASSDSCYGALSTRVQKTAESDGMSSQVRHVQPVCGSEIKQPASVACRPLAHVASKACPHYSVQYREGKSMTCRSTSRQPGKERAWGHEQLTNCLRPRSLLVRNFLVRIVHALSPMVTNETLRVCRENEGTRRSC